MSWWNDPSSKNAFILCIVSLILTTVAAVAGLALYAKTQSALCLMFGLENLVDFASSAIVLWRFYCPGELTKAREEFLMKREERASIGISFILLVLGIFVISAALDDLVGGAETQSDLKIVKIISFVSIFIFGSLAFVKFGYASKLGSTSLRKDGLCSLIGTVLALGLFGTTFLVEKVPSIWWLDPVFATLCGAAALVLGLHAIYVTRFAQGLPIFSISWWVVSPGVGKNEMDGGFGEEGNNTIEMPGSTEGEHEEKTKLSEVV